MFCASFNAPIILETFGEKYRVWNSFHIFAASCFFLPHHSILKYIYSVSSSYPIRETKFYIHWKQNYDFVY